MAARLRVGPTRFVLNAIQGGALTRRQIFEAVPRELVPSMSRLTSILRNLHEKKRVVVRPERRAL